MRPGITWPQTLERMLYSRNFWRYGAAAVLLVAIGIACFIDSKVTIPAEDAIMLFDYSRNLATRGVITYGNGSSVPIEGATDFLYMALIALISRIGLSEFASALVLNYLGIVLICYLFYKRVNSISLPLIAILATPFFYATLLGFSAMLFSAMYILCLYLMLNNDRRLYLAVLCLCLIRPDGVIWSAGIIAVRLLEMDKNGLETESKYLLGYLVLPGLAYFAWRVWYFGEWLPLPFIVKASGSRSFDETMAAILPVLAPAVAAIMCADDMWRLSKLMALLFAVPVLFYSSIRLEQNTGNRFLSPMFFGTLMVLATRDFKPAVRIFIFLSICFSWRLTVETFDSIADSSAETSRPIGLMLRQLPQGKLLSTEAGKLAYYSNWEAEDSWGLNTPKFSHKLITKEGVADGAYDLIVASCPITLLNVKTQIKSGADKARTWLNQCEALTGFLSASDYDIVLVPTVNGPPSSAVAGWMIRNPNCAARYTSRLIYGISPAYLGNVQIREILRQFGGVAFDEVADCY